MSAEKHFWPRWIFTCAHQKPIKVEPAKKLSRIALCSSSLRSLERRLEEWKFGSAHEEQLDEKRLRDA